MSHKKRNYALKQSHVFLDVVFSFQVRECKGKRVKEYVNIVLIINAYHGASVFGSFYRFCLLNLIK